VFLGHSVRIPPIAKDPPISVQTHDRATGAAGELCVLARMIPQRDALPEHPLEELSGLAETAGATVVAGVIQRRDHPDQTTYLGKGKIAELKGLVDLHDADMVVFDNDLSPSQTRNLEKALEVKVLDRSELILDIFANNARTYESRLAVELAQLEYSLPRLKRMWTHLSRQTMGVGMRGPGEKQLEVDRRLAEKRIHELKDELSKIERRKEREVASRDSLSVSIVGYTNAGKSTLMNALTNANVEAVDKLFATLDTRTRKWMLPGWGPVLLSDTVGFIRDLPHRLIASFRATLAEARQADLLLHVADASNEAVLDQISSVYKVLRELGIDEKDTLLVLNKIDRPGAAERIESVQARYPNAIPISAHRRSGFAAMSMSVSNALTRDFVELEVRLPPSDGKTAAWLSSVSEVLSKQYDDDYVFVRSRMTAGHAGKLVSQGFDVRVLSGKIPQKTLDSMSPQTATFKPVAICDEVSDVSTEENPMGDVA
jgi:GTPase